jgi:hypothetical protein
MCFDTYMSTTCLKKEKEKKQQMYVSYDTSKLTSEFSKLTLSVSKINLKQANIQPM